MSTTVPLGAGLRCRYVKVIGYHKLCGRQRVPLQRGSLILLVMSYETGSKIKPIICINVKPLVKFPQQAKILYLYILSAVITFLGSEKSNQTGFIYIDRNKDKCYIYK